MIDQKLVDRADALIDKGESVIRTATPAVPRGRGQSRMVAELTLPPNPDYGQWSEWRSQSLRFLRSMLGDSDTYAVHFDEMTRICDISDLKAGLGILRAVRDDIAQGNLARLPELIHADLFSDFLEMAEHLLDSGYKDPAAVLIGGVLEQHLRLLCGKEGIPTFVGGRPKKAETMNVDLNKADVYATNQQKIVTGWLGIRNSAAHGRTEEYTADQVRQLMAGIREFISRFRA